jgi:hypothetical protein
MQTKNNLVFNSVGSIVDIFGALDLNYAKNNEKNDVDILLNDWKILANDFLVSKSLVMKAE